MAFGLNFDDGFERSMVNSLGQLSEIEDLQGSESEKTQSSVSLSLLTTDSYGVLSDVRTGGQSVILVTRSNTKDWTSSLEQSTYNWIDDFIGYIYKDRPLFEKCSDGTNAKANK